MGCCDEATAPAGRRSISLSDMDSLRELNQVILQTGFGTKEPCRKRERQLGTAPNVAQIVAKSTNRRALSGKSCVNAKASDLYVSVWTGADVGGPRRWVVFGLQANSASPDCSNSPDIPAAPACHLPVIAVAVVRSWRCSLVRPLARQRRNETGGPKAAGGEEHVELNRESNRDLNRDLSAFARITRRTYSSILAFGAIAEAGSFSSTLSTSPYESMSCAVSQLLRSQSAVIFSID